MAIPQSNDPCGVGESLALLSGRWKGPLIWWLRQHRRFGELRRLVPEITPRVLTSQLRQMERDGLVLRKDFHEMPPRVEYRLSPVGESLLPLLDRVREWSAMGLLRVHEARQEYDQSAESS